MTTSKNRLKNLRCSFQNVCLLIPFLLFVQELMYVFLFLLQRSPSQGLPFSQQDDAQSTRSGDTPVTSQSNTNSSHNADNNSEIGKCRILLCMLNVRKISALILCIVLHKMLCGMTDRLDSDKIV